MCFLILCAVLLPLFGAAAAAAAAVVPAVVAVVATCSGYKLRNPKPSIPKSETLEIVNHPTAQIPKYPRTTLWDFLEARTTAHRGLGPRRSGLWAPSRRNGCRMSKTIPLSSPQSLHIQIQTNLTMQTMYYQNICTYIPICTHVGVCKLPIFVIYE